MKRFREDPWLATHGGWFSALMVASIALLFAQCSSPKGWKDSSAMEVPKLEHAPVIDGDLSEWKDLAFSDGSWDIDRLRHAPWFDSTVNRLTNHGERERPEDDLTARYYIAWDDRYLYLGAEVHDNVNDIVDPRHCQRDCTSRTRCAGSSKLQRMRNLRTSRKGTMLFVS